MKIYSTNIYIYIYKLAGLGSTNLPQHTTTTPPSPHPTTKKSEKRRGRGYQKEGPAGWGGRGSQKKGALGLSPLFTVLYVPERLQGFLYVPGILRGITIRDWKVTGKYHPSL